MIIYVLKHKNPKFSGVFCGIGFSNGRGSTSSKVDRDQLVQHGCKDITQQISASQAAKRKKSEDAAAKAKKEADKKAAKKDKVEEPEKEDSDEEPEKEEEEEKVEEPEKEEK